ncbi:DUF3866 family protein [Irregularibacter muris]|uniref:DUF3866 family protein n=1 Tax=Irregularibacter muris TaxID=1796619 RepID=A0AAE3KYR2_9FIRM|nr:DUF3866 family protein [Irregularibacter muris]MCR1898035.1 DUF3866 family protein [Irregularibacter muris]
MLDREIGTVIEILFEDEDFQELIVSIGEFNAKAMNYISLSGKCNIGNKVLLNTTAVRLQLGTGGYHFVIANLDKGEDIQKKTGHIMKMRYTPLQLVTPTMEEQDSPYHEAINSFHSLEGIPVIVGSLHSMLAPAITMIKYHNPKIKITYIMSDGASLPMTMSKTVKSLKSKNLIDSTITYGHAFGGDYEAVNVYTALIGAKEVTHCDIAIVTMGPGIVGTGTKYGFTGVEQGNIIDAINTLQGFPIAIPRISFADRRSRHCGLSHHSITTLTHIVNSSCLVAFPEIKDNEKMGIIEEQIKNNRIAELHSIQFKNVDHLERVLLENEIKVSTMGRNYMQDPEFFNSAAAAGLIALEKLNTKGK